MQKNMQNTLCIDADILPITAEFGTLMLMLDT